MSSTKRVKVWQDDAGEWRWTYWRSSDRVATAGEGYQNKSYVVDQARALFPDARLEIEEPDGTWKFIAAERPQDAVVSAPPPADTGESVVKG